MLLHNKTDAAACVCVAIHHFINTQCQVESYGSVFISAVWSGARVARCENKVGRRDDGFRMNRGAALSVDGKMLQIGPIAND